MALYEKMMAAMEDMNVEAFEAMLDEDFEFVRHQSGTTIDKSGMSDLMNRFKESGAWKIESSRLIYENDDILVWHSTMRFPDGTREAVMGVEMLKDGKIIRSETGATPLT